MVEHPDIHPPPDDQSEVDKVDGLADAPVTALGLSRFDLKYSNGGLPHGKLMTSIELYGTKVVPMVRERLG